MNYDFDVIVIGSGHAGCEAAHASAKLESKTLMVGLNLDTVAWMPCNPAIGGPAKSHIVKEIDALGGAMGLCADASYLQTKTLNLSRGRAVHSLRMQSDKYEYSRWMNQYLHNTENLYFYQAMITGLLIEKSTIKGVITKHNEKITAKAVIITSGTFLGGKVFSGKNTQDSGRASEPSVIGLTQCLQEYGLEFDRLKTGTPTRLDSRSINFEILEEHAGDPEISHFSYLPNRPIRPQYSCYSTRTNAKTHQIIQENLHLNPMYCGMIDSKGPRYCPSIEDKIYKFSDKESHNLFLEPESLTSNEIYLQGCSTSFDINIQRQIIQSIVGLEKAHIVRPAYSVEYDFLKPVQMNCHLQTNSLQGLFAAGQLLGTSGYEEAAAQGLIAGINAAKYSQNQELIELDRAESYIGTLIDDLIHKDINEPYRMMTSRSEYRLYLRQDNTDQRLTPLGHSIGLVDEFRWKTFNTKLELFNTEIALLEKTRLSPSQCPAKFEIKNNNISLKELLTRTDCDYTDIDNLLNRSPDTSCYIPKFEVETDIKYAGYIIRQRAQINKIKKLYSVKIPRDFDYAEITHLSKEAKEKLILIKPETLGQAYKIDGVRQADINILLMKLK